MEKQCEATNWYAPLDFEAWVEADGFSNLENTVGEALKIPFFGFSEKQRQFIVL